MSKNYTRKSPCPRCLLTPEVIGGVYEVGMVYQDVNVFTPHWELGPPEYEPSDWSECDSCDTHPIGRHPAWTRDELEQLEATATD
jgi:hypothetical protein